MTSQVRTKARRKWLETLVDAMTAPADAMREHLAGANQNATLGAAAEAGVRSLLRAVVPTRIGVTSGFLRELVAAASTKPSAAGVEAVGEAAGAAGSETAPPVSPQTDVLLYDASLAVPLYGIGGVDILSAYDVLGVIEIKDTNRGTSELATRFIERKEGQGLTKDKGALEHIDAVRRYAGRAFRGVVLFRGTGGAPGSEAQKVTELVLKEISSERILEVPHFIYCASSFIGNADKGFPPPLGGYLAFYDCRSETMRVVEYVHDQGSALAGFLRIVTGFLAVQGLVSPAMHLDMQPAKVTSSESFELPSERPRPQDLYPLLKERRGGAVAAAAAEATTAPNVRTFDQAFTDVLKEEQGKDQGVAVWSFASTGRGPDDMPTSGLCLEVEIARRGRFRAFFYLLEPGVFTCAGADGADPWQIEVEGESFNDYMRRILRENGLLELFQRKAPGGRRLPADRTPAESSTEEES